MSAQLTQLLMEDGVTLPVGYCLACHKEVVVHGKLGSGPRAGQLLWHCLFCDQEILQEAEGLREHDVSTLQTLGYAVVEPDEVNDTGSSCGSGGCSSGGCSS